MKTSITGFFKQLFPLLLFIMVLPYGVRAQEINLKDGKFYKIHLSSDYELEGKVLSQDSVRVKLETLQGNVKVRKEQIISYAESSPEFVEQFKTKDVVSLNKREKPVNIKASLGGGVLLQSGDDESTTGFSLNANYYIFLSHYVGMRVGVNFDHFSGERGEVTLTYGTGETENLGIWESGDENFYTLKYDLLVGGFNPGSGVSPYALAGVGFGMWQSGESKYTYYDYYLNSNTTQIYEGNSFLTLQIGIGGGIGFKVSNKLRIYTEAKYSFTTPLSEGTFGFGLGMLNLNAGVMF